MSRGWPLRGAGRPGLQRRPVQRPRVTHGRRGPAGPRRQGARRAQWGGDPHLQGDDVLSAEGLVGQQVSEVLGLDVQLLHRLQPGGRPRSRCPLRSAAQRPPGRGKGQRRGPEWPQEAHPCAPRAGPGAGLPPGSLWPHGARERGPTQQTELPGPGLEATGRLPPLDALVALSS